MLFFKRFLTFLVLTPLLCLLFFFGFLVVGGAVMGATAAASQKATTYEAGQEIGRQAGQEFAEKYGMTVLAAAAGLGILIGAGLSFTGVFPWCRAPRTPPPLLPRDQPSM